MKKSANEIIKTKLNKLLDASRMQRLVLVDILKIFGEKIDTNMQMFEELVYLIERQNQEYKILTDIENTQIIDKNTAIEIIKELNSIENITSLLEECLISFIELALIFNINDKVFFKDEYYTILIQKNSMIKDMINNDYKILQKKIERRK